MHRYTSAHRKIGMVNGKPWISKQKTQRKAIVSHVYARRSNKEIVESNLVPPKDVENFAIKYGIDLEECGEISLSVSVRCTISKEVLRKARKNG